MAGRISSAKKERTVEDDEYFEEIRKHVVAITTDLGQALYATFNRRGDPTTEDVFGCWQSLGNSICDFGEFLDD